MTKMSKTVSRASQMKTSGRSKGKVSPKGYSYKVKERGASMKDIILKNKKPGTSLNDYSLDLMQLD